MSAKVAVTGGTGRIGRALVASLIQEGYDVSVLSRKKNINSLNYRTVQGDLTLDDCPLRELVRGCEIVFHCAAELSNVSLMRRLHSDGTKRLIAAVADEAKYSDIKINWVQLSSVGVYGPPKIYSQPRTITETSELQPFGEYEVTKSNSDSLVIGAAGIYPFYCNVLRPSNVLVPNELSPSISGLIDNIRRGRFFHIGPPGSIATFIHVNDVVGALIKCGERKNNGATEVFNLSNDCLWEDIVNAIADGSGVKKPQLRLPETIIRSGLSIVQKVLPIPLTQNRINSLVCRTSYPLDHIQEALGICPVHDVPDTFRQIVKAKYN
jgi:nucleoside-diphosphate-sugar epimerase